MRHSPTAGGVRWTCDARSVVSGMWHDAIGPSGGMCRRPFCLSPRALTDPDAEEAAKARRSNGMRTRSCSRCWKAWSLPRLRSSAHWLWAPPHERPGVQQRLEDQEAKRPRNFERSQLVVKSLFTPPSVGVLSLSVKTQQRALNPLFLSRLEPKSVAGAKACATWPQIFHVPKALQ